MTETELHVTTITSALADAPEGTIVLGPGHETPGVDARGLANIWLIFPDAASRDAYQNRYYRTWIETPTAASFADYCFTWKDASGYGLQLATFCPDNIGRPRR